MNIMMMFGDDGDDGDKILETSKRICLETRPTRHIVCANDGPHSNNMIMACTRIYIYIRRRIMIYRRVYVMILLIMELSKHINGVIYFLLGHLIFSQSRADGNLYIALLDMRKLVATHFVYPC